MERPRAGGAAALPPPLGLPLLAAGWGDARGDSAMPSAPLLVQPRGSVQLKQQAQQTVPALLTLPSWPAWVAVVDAAAAAPKHHAACAVAFCDVRPGACSSDSSPRLNAVAVLAAAAPHTEQPAPVPQHFQLPPHRMPAKQSGQQYKLQLPWERAPLSAVTMQQPHHSCSDAAPNHDGGSRASPAACCGEQRPPPGLRALGRAINGEAGKLLGLVGAQLLLHAANLQRGMAALQQQKQLERQLESGGEAQHLQRPHGLAGWRPRFPWQRPAGLGGATDSAAAAAASSAGAWHARDAAQQWVVRGVAAEANMDLRAALACYTNAVTLVPGDSALLCRLAKQWSDLTYEPGASVEAIQEVNTKAAEYAQRAITLAPQSAGGHMAECVSKGRLALFSDNKTKVRLAKEAQEAARAALALEPGNDLAHHLMGRWHYEMAQINFVMRQLIRIVYGAALSPGRFEDALSEFESAVSLNPHKLIHRVELGRTHLRLGHRRQAYEQLSASLALEVEDINAKLQREDAELLLDKLRGEFERGVSWGGGLGITTSGGPTPAAAPMGAGEDSSSSNSQK